MNKLKSRAGFKERLQYVCRSDQRTALTELFHSDVETALFYFYGHGYVDDLSGYLITSECSFGDDGYRLH